MVQLYSAAAAGDDTAGVLDQIDTGMTEDAVAARFVCASYGGTHDDDQILARLRDRYPYASIIGGTSAAGVFARRHIRDARAIALLAICDADGDYGVGAADWGSETAGAVRRAFAAALVDAGSPDVAPAMVWVCQAPGHESIVARVLREIVGERCPIIGADESDAGATGAWRQIGPGGVTTHGIAVGVLFPSTGTFAVADEPGRGLPIYHTALSGADPIAKACRRSRTS